MKIYLLTICTCCLSGCFIPLKKSYYFSPFMGDNSNYHVTPLRTDTLRSATLVGGSFYKGDDNEDARDHIINVQANIYHSHRFGMFQAYYGLMGSLGNYKVATLGSANISPTVNSKQIDAHAGNKFVGGYGLDAGFNLVPFSGRRVEYRVLGIEGSYHKEYGDYLNFRNKLPDSAATIILRDDYLATVGLTTEVVAKFRKSSVGWQVGYGYVLGVRQNNFPDPGHHHALVTYLNFNVHYTHRNRATYFLNVHSADRASGIKIGGAYRISK